MRRRLSNKNVWLLLLLLTCCHHLAVSPSRDSDDLRYKCFGKYNGKKLTQDELTIVLSAHAKWRANPNQRQFWANLCGAKLEGLSLKDADLEGADLSFALLDSEKYPTNLQGIHLKNSKLIGTNFAKSDLSDADLRNAQLHTAIMTRVTLTSADLRGADLWGANLQDAWLYRANLAGSYFDVASLPFAESVASLPFAESMVSAKGLAQIRFAESPNALMELRTELGNMGLRSQRNELTYAIKRTEMKSAGTIERWFNYIAFDLTCAYGMYPGRPLKILGVVIVVFSVLYVFAQTLPSKRSAIWAEWSKDRINKDEGSDTPVKLIAGFPSDGLCSRQKSILSIAGLALYFSVLSTARIGWGEFANLGVWLIRSQPREYILRATGWVRLASGIQSIVSVYLLALSILTYFGNPFE